MRSLAHVTGRRQAEIRGQRSLLALIFVCAAVFLTALDQTVVVTALPQIVADLQIPILQLDRASWIISGYLLGYVIAMPLLGQLADRYGRRRLLLLCLALFACASLVCGLAPWLGSQNDLSFLQMLGVDVQSPGLVWLVGARVLQAAGGGAVVPIAMAIVGDYYGTRGLGPALGLIGMVTEAGGVLGPLYGAWITQTLGWSAIFLLNLPLVAALMVPLAFSLRESVQVSMPRKEKRPGVDLVGAALLGAVLLCLSLGLAQEAALLTAGQPGDLQARGALESASAHGNPVLLGLALLLLVLLVIVELRLQRGEPPEEGEAGPGGRGRWSRLRLPGRGAPVLDLRLFRRLSFVAAAVVSLLVGAALIIAMVDIPIFVATVLGETAISSGLALLRLTAMIPVGALVGGWLCERLGSRPVAVAGLLCAAAAFWLMHWWPLRVDWNQITLSTMLGGWGFGLVIAPIGVIALDAAREQRGGLAAALVTMLRMVGMILGLAALTSWGLGYFRALAAAFVPPPGVTPFSSAYLDAYTAYLVAAAHTVYTTIFLVAGVLCLLAVIPALAFRESQPVAFFKRIPKEEQESAPVVTGVVRPSQTEGEAVPAPDPREGEQL
ncbi:MAG: MFS transporter [Thermogemmatispora sp.]|uniref:MFS transporter n=1 Tax=Thermogemmatispora sp. TaxID=1968838 RepID=UPI0019F17345|nr:MFS transporter [Thermogemmatispora sp.]MBE3566918.1 MFS transporter [Thermogemmatispora sp.]